MKTLLISANIGIVTLITVRFNWAEDGTMSPQSINHLLNIRPDTLMTFFSISYSSL